MTQDKGRAITTAQLDHLEKGESRQESFMDEVHMVRKNILSKFADPSKKLPGLQYEDGVVVAVSKTRPGVVLFEFATTDDQRIQIQYDCRISDRDYIDALVRDLLDKIHDHKAQRASPILSI